MKLLAWRACTLAIAAMSASPATCAELAPPRSADELRNAFLAYHAAKDAEGARALFCSGESAPSMIRFYENELHEVMGFRIAEVELAPIGPHASRSSWPVELLGMLRIHFEEEERDGVTQLSRGFNYGAQDGRYCLAIPVAAEAEPD